MRIICNISPVLKITRRLSCNYNAREFTSLVQVLQCNRRIDNAGLWTNYFNSRKLYNDADTIIVKHKSEKKDQIEVSDTPLNENSILPVALIDINPSNSNSTKILLFPLNGNETALRNTLTSFFSQKKNLRQIEAFGNALRQIPGLQRNLNNTNSQNISISELENEDSEVKEIQTKSSTSLEQPPILPQPMEKSDELIADSDSRWEHLLGLLKSFNSALQTASSINADKWKTLHFKSDTLNENDQSLALAFVTNCENAKLCYEEFLQQRRLPYDPLNLFFRKFSTKYTDKINNPDTKITQPSDDQNKRDNKPESEVSDTTKSIIPKRRRRNRCRVFYNSPFLSELLGGQSKPMSVEIYDKALVEAAKRRAALAESPAVKRVRNCSPQKGEKASNAESNLLQQESVLQVSKLGVTQERKVSTSGKGFYSKKTDKPKKTKPCEQEEPPYKPQCHADPCASKKKDSGGKGGKKSICAEQKSSSSSAETRDPCTKRLEKVTKQASRCGKSGDKKKSSLCGTKTHKTVDPCAKTTQKKADPCGKSKTAQKKANPCTKPIKFKKSPKKDLCGNRKGKTSSQKIYDPCAKSKTAAKKPDPCAKTKSAAKKPDPCAKLKSAAKKPDPCAKSKPAAKKTGPAQKKVCSKPIKFKKSPKKDLCGKRKAEKKQSTKIYDACKGKRPQTHSPARKFSSRRLQPHTPVRKFSNTTNGQAQVDLKPKIKHFSTLGIDMRKILTTTRSINLKLNNNLKSFGFTRHYSKKVSKKDRSDPGPRARCQAVVSGIPQFRKTVKNGHPKDGLRMCYPEYELECPKKLCKNPKQSACKNFLKSTETCKRLTKK